MNGRRIEGARIGSSQKAMETKRFEIELDDGTTLFVWGEMTYSDVLLRVEALSADGEVTKFA
jgi:hypothetical protein